MSADSESYIPAKIRMRAMLCDTVKVQYIETQTCLAIVCFVYDQSTARVNIQIVDEMR